MGVSCWEVKFINRYDRKVTRLECHGKGLKKKNLLFRYEGMPYYKKMISVKRISAKDYKRRRKHVVSRKRVSTKAT